MHTAIRAAGFSLMTMFVSCGVGAQDLDTRIGKIAMEGELPAHESIARLYAELDFQQATPTAPQGFENNWVQTLPGKHWFSYFRLYAPTEAYFDKSWKLDDITAVQ
jgi:hypothetical protein